MVSTAASPAVTPLVVPIIPPKIIAVSGLFKPIFFAMAGVNNVTSTDFITPIAILMAMISELAPMAVPVTGPTIKVQAPAPIVTNALMSSYFKRTIRSWPKS